MFGRKSEKSREEDKKPTIEEAVKKLLGGGSEEDYENAIRIEVDRIWNTPKEKAPSSARPNPQR
jgi:hypothetical protein